jgi:Ser/Thr protein kinase RdoA (MazF antagonist)
MAKMHDHAERFKLPQSLPCPEWNWERLFGQSDGKVAAAERQLLTPAERRLFRRVADRAQETMDRLGTSRRVYGLIHADLIQANYLIHHGNVHLIDFAELGRGHFLYDMGITLYGLWGLDPGLEQRQAFLAGYKEVRKFSPNHEALIDVFTTARAVVQGRFVMTSSHPADREIAPRYIRQVLACIRAWESQSKASAL